MEGSSQYSIITVEASKKFETSEALYSTYLDVLLGHIGRLDNVSDASNDYLTRKPYQIAHDDLRLSASGSQTVRYNWLHGTFGCLGVLLDSSHWCCGLSTSGWCASSSTATATSSTLGHDDVVESHIKLCRHDGSDTQLRFLLAVLRLITSAVAM